MSELALKLYTFVDGVNDTPFPSATAQAVLTDWQYNSKRMGGTPYITGGTILHQACLDAEWTEDVYVEYKGEKFFAPHKPTSSYSSQSVMYDHKVDFFSERAVLDNVYFYDVVSEQDSGGKPISNNTKFTFFGTIDEFIVRLNASMARSNTGYSVVLDDNQENTDVEKQIKFIEKYISEALQEGFKVFGIPYYFVGKVCHYGVAQSSVLDNMVFEYGRDKNLIAMTKTNANTKIVNRITGVGSADNIPYYYPNSSEEGVAGVDNIVSPTITAINVVDDMLLAKKIAKNDVVKYGTWETTLNIPMFYGDGVAYSEDLLAPSEDFAGKTVHIVIPLPITFNCTSLHLRLVPWPSGRFTPSVITYANFILSPDIAGKTIHVYEHDNMVDLDATGNIAKGTYTLEFDATFPADAYLNWSSIRFSGDRLGVTATAWKDMQNGNLFQEDLSDVGLSIQGTATTNDTFKRIVVRQVVPQPNLMPSIYRESNGNERFYNATNNTYINPDTGEYYVFPKPYRVGKPKEYIHDENDIKPSIVNVVNANNEPIDHVIKFAFDENDNDQMDENGKYLHPYFFALLNKTDGEFGFNLFDQATDEAEMSLSMTSGSLGGCEFIIGVGEDSQKNTVQIELDANLQPVLDEDGHPVLKRDENGDVIYGLEGRQSKQVPQSWQNDTYNNEVWVALKKDTSTYDVIMPNDTYGYKPQEDDEDSFVLLHIDLPKAYILAAEKALEDSLIAFMAESNDEHWNFSIDFSRIYLKETPSVASAIDENKKIKIKYNGVTYERYISSYSYKTSVGELLPNISVELAESLETSSNPIDTAISEVTNLMEIQANAIIGYQQVARLARLALPASNVQNVGHKNLPVYFDGTKAKTIEGLDVPENIRTEKNVEAMGGVAAHGMATLQRGGGGGMGTVTGINVNGTLYEPSQGLITLPDYPTAASLISDGLASQSYVQSYFSDNFTQANIKSTLGISDWALAASKPSYNFSEIGSKPTTLAGYGITDAHITSGVITLGGNTITPATLTNGKIPLSQIPDAILGQLIYGGTVNGSGVVTLSQNAKDKWGITSLTLTSTNYSTYEGAFFIASADATSGVPSTLGLLVGDWVVATASGWGKIDNTDAVTGVKGDAESSYRIGNVNITKGNIGLGNVENTALSTWAGTANISTLGTITTGVWHGSAIGYDYLASGVQTSLGKADTVRDYFDTNGLLNKANHYSPASDSSADYSASASGATADWSIDVVKGVQIQRDAKGHILGVTVTSGKIPAKPTYAFSDLTSHPTTLSGYGITDGVNGFQMSGSGYLSNVDFVEGNPHSLAFTFTSFAKAQIGHTGGSGTTTYKVRVKADGAWSDYLALQQAGASAWGIVTDQAQTFGGDKTFNDNIQSMKGVAARGMATLQRSGGGGSGTVTSIQFGSASVIAADNGLLSVPVGQGTSNGQINIGGQDISVKGLAALAYLPSLAFGDLTTHPTTLGDYGITDAKIENGVITLGSNSITPLTGITSSMVTTALGYTPFNNASFTQANIQSTLGISNWALASSKPSYAFSEITGTASESQIPTLAISKISGLQTALDSKLATSLKGAANGLAELDANGLVPSSQLPSYVDDVLEYSSKSAFPSTGETGKIYVALDTNLTYRWSGTAYVEISPSLALGETSSTAYRGDRGKTAYDHATETKSGAQNSGFYKFATTAEGHIASVTAVTASDLTTLIGNTTYAPYNADGYLPLTGGTITGSTSAPLIIQSTNNNNYACLQLKSKNHYRTFGLNEYGDLFTTNIDGWANEYKVWHAGNDGADSGLDADKLDGQEGSYYATASSVTTLQGYFTDGVAKSALKLENSRTLWGQSFNGTADIGTDKFAKMPYLLFRTVTSGSDATIGYVGRDSTSDVVNLKGYTNIPVSIGSGQQDDIYVTADHKVGVGLTNPSDKFHVNGNIIANGGVAARGMATLQGGAGTGNPVTQINIGSTPYTPTDGIVSLPAYPTWSTLSGKPTNVSAFTNDSGYIDSSALAVTFTTTTLTSSSTSVYLNNTVQRDTLQKIIISSANNNQQFNIHLRGSGSYYGYHRQVYIHNQSGKDIYIQLTGVVYISMGAYVSVNPNTGAQLVNYNPISMDDDYNYMYLLDIIQADSSEYPIVKITHLDTWAD